MNIAFPLAVAAIVGSATVACADTSFSLPRLQPHNSLLYFDVVNSDADGVLEVYDFNGHAVGKLLGSAPVALGANRNLRVRIDPHTFNDLIAVLKIDGIERANQVVEFHRHGR